MCESTSNSVSSSSSSNESSIDSSDNDYDVVEVTPGIEPWRFEPPGRGTQDNSSDDSGDEVEGQNNGRLQVFDWYCLNQFFNDFIPSVAVLFINNSSLGYR